MCAQKLWKRQKVFSTRVELDGLQARRVGFDSHIKPEISTGTPTQYSLLLCKETATQSLLCAINMKFCKKCECQTERNKRGECKKCHSEYNKKWNLLNPEKAQALKIKSAEWKKQNKEKIQINDCLYRASNIDSYRIYEHNRRNRKKYNGGKLSKDLSQKLFILQKGKCPCCKKLLGNDYHLDHIVPLALGGANEDWNMQLLRSTCNLNKSAKHPIEYMQSKGFLL